MMNYEKMVDTYLPPLEWGGVKERNMGNNLKHYRKINGFTQQETAQKAGYGFSTYKRLEYLDVDLNKVEYGRLKRLARALNTTCDDLCDRIIKEGQA